MISDFQTKFIDVTFYYLSRTTNYVTVSIADNPLRENLGYWEVKCIHFDDAKEMAIYFSHCSEEFIGEGFFDDELSAQKLCVKKNQELLSELSEKLFDKMYNN